MKVFASPDVIEDIKKSLQNRNKSAVRIGLEGFGWAGPTFAIALDEQKENDEVFEIDGVKFVADKEFSFLVNGFKIVKVGNGYEIEGNGGCGH